jgi:hypothetical protein
VRAKFIALAGKEHAQFLGELERLTTSWAAVKSSRMQDVKWCHPKVGVKHLAGARRSAMSLREAWRDNPIQSVLRIIYPMSTPNPKATTKEATKFSFMISSAS